MTAAPALHLFAKTPIPGHVKTRLQPQYSAKQAARIAAWCIEQTARLASSSWNGPLYLHVWPSEQHHLFQELRRRLPIAIRRQAYGDLGAKMHCALEFAYPGAVMGCDVPQCPAESLTRANRTLREGADVIGASHDGGYYFIGLTRPHRQLFEGFNWDDDGVFSHTLAQAEELGLNFEQLPPLTDLDTWEDIEQVRRVFPPLHELLARL